MCGKLSAIRFVASSEGYLLFDDTVLSKSAQPQNRIGPFSMEWQCTWYY